MNEIKQWAACWWWWAYYGAADWCRARVAPHWWAMRVRWWHWRAAWRFRVALSRAKYRRRVWSRVWQ